MGKASRLTLSVTDTWSRASLTPIAFGERKGLSSLSSSTRENMSFPGFKGFGGMGDMLGWPLKASTRFLNS